MDEDVRLEVENGEDRALVSKGEVNLLLEKKEADFNAYATSKSVSQEALNTTGIQAKIGIVVGLFAVRDNTLPLSSFEIALVSLIAISLLMEFIMFVFLVLLAAAKKEQMSCGCTATMINNAVTAISGFNLILNLAISVVSVETMKSNVGAAVARILRSQQLEILEMLRRGGVEETIIKTIFKK